MCNSAGIGDDEDIESFFNSDLPRGSVVSLSSGLGGPINQSARQAVPGVGAELDGEGHVVLAPAEAVDRYEEMAATGWLARLWRGYRRSGAGGARLDPRAAR